MTDITPFGGLIKQYQIEVDPVALTKYNLSIRDIAQAVDANNQNAGGALLDNQQQGLVVRGVGLIQSVADIENIVVTAANGVPVFVRDVGRVQIGSAPRTGIFAIGDKSDRVEGIVLMRRGENPSEVLDGIHEAVDELNASGLPPGVRMVADLRPDGPGRQHAPHRDAHPARRAGHRRRRAVPVSGQRRARRC